MRFIKKVHFSLTEDLPLRPVNANNGTAEWQFDEEAAIDFAIDLVKRIADQVSI